MTKATATKQRHIPIFTALACLAIAGCDQSRDDGNIVEVERGTAGPKVDSEAYAEQRLADGAVTLIDAAAPDGTLMPAAHSGPTWGELEEARKERERAAAEARADEEPARDAAAERFDPVRSRPPAPPAPPASTAPSPPPPPVAPANSAAAE